MVRLSLAGRRFTYSHDCEGPIDIHHVVPDKNPARNFLLSLFVILLLANALYLFLDKDSSSVTAFWCFLPSGFLVILLSQKSVKKESVIIIPAFGVQLETHYSSGRTVCRFFPIDKILKPELLPPVKMLIPIWKALCAATNTGQSAVIDEEDALY